mmetsp:Transcript_12079/g.14978  ORF Transcript_12079/g.14978 Transcript_12079/m.14978 type:complete len:81 (-) Transcript_12079:47-289(-)
MTSCFRTSECRVLPVVETELIRQEERQQQVADHDAAQEHGYGGAIEDSADPSGAKRKRPARGILSLPAIYTAALSASSAQ